ncbi:6-phosphogluconolactonase [mine drainage metagenome]|uniref:6-phosphogluconolactonase n=1 Tax=mine drainage metagenome TaxID=410659 RepID=A0A1J5PNW1_9ZZZZ
MASGHDAIALAVDSALTAIHGQWESDLAAHLVLAGGRSGSDVAAGIAAGLTEPRPKVLHLWFADERFVEYGDPDRNDFALIKAFASVGCTLVVHRYGTPSSVDFAYAARHYVTELQRALGDEPFTIVILSMGEDGHVASIFPSRAESAGDVFAVDDAPKAPPRRISLSLDRLAKNNGCLLLALGGSKSSAIRALIDEDLSLPATLLAMKTPLILITDQPIGNQVEASQS